MRIMKGFAAAAIVVSIGACRTSAASLEPSQDSPVSPRGEQAPLPVVAASLKGDSLLPAAGSTDTARPMAHEHHGSHGMPHGDPSSQGGAGHDH